MDSIISLVVQEYFCYRIWTLNKRLLWPCVLIAMVRGFPFLPRVGAAMTLPGLRLEQFNQLERHGAGSRQPLYHHLSVTMSDCGPVTYAWKVCCF
jgi:hypothetical protein